MLHRNDESEIRSNTQSERGAHEGTEFYAIFSLMFFSPQNAQQGFMLFHYSLTGFPKLVFHVLLSFRLSFPPIVKPQPLGWELAYITLKHFQKAGCIDLNILFKIS